MVWSWSHTEEAYVHARKELGQLPHSVLAEIYAEWKAYRPDPDKAYRPDPDGVVIGSEQFIPAAYTKHHARALKLDNDDLISFIWDRANDQRNCDNGGWNAWMCPFGCGPHCVSFGP